MNESQSKLYPFAVYTISALELLSRYDAGMLSIDDIPLMYLADIMIDKREIENTQKLKSEAKVAEKENRAVERAKAADAKKERVKAGKQTSKGPLSSEIVHDSDVEMDDGLDEDSDAFEDVRDPSEDEQGTGTKGRGGPLRGFRVDVPSTLPPNRSGRFDDGLPETPVATATQNRRRITEQERDNDMSGEESG